MRVSTLERPPIGSCRCSVRTWRLAMTFKCVTGMRAISVLHDGNAQFDSGDDARFVALLLRRHAAAWRAFRARYEVLIRAVVRRSLARYSVRNDTDVDDAYALFLMNLLVNDMSRLRCFDSQRGVKLSTWLGHLATNAAYDHLRVVRRGARTMRAYTSDVMQDQSDSLAVLLAEEELRELRSKLDSLRAKDRCFLEQLIVEEEATVAIADRHKVSIKTVYTRKHKIIARMKAAK